MEMTPIEKAMMKRLTFDHPSVGGKIDVTDLFTLTLTDLDRMHGQVTQRLDTNAGGLLEKPSASTYDDRLRKAVIERVFTAKREDQTRAAARQRNIAMRNKIAEVIARKQDGALEDKSLEELQEMLAGTAEA